MQCKIVILMDNRYLDGFIVRFDDDSMAIRCTLRKGIVLDTLVHIHIYNPVKGEVILCGVVNSIIENMIRLVNVKCIAINQRRKDARVNIDVKLYVNKIQVGGSKLIDLEKNMLFKSVDISAGGILLHSQLDIPTNLRFHLQIPAEELIACTAQIVRKEKKEHGFFYGCELIDISESKKDKIREFVFKKQIEEYKNKRVLKTINF
ncbi:MAG: PilZ domain-containing protein [Clostridia bacterium]